MEFSGRPYNNLCVCRKLIPLVHIPSLPAFFILFFFLLSPFSFSSMFPSIHVEVEGPLRLFSFQRITKYLLPFYCCGCESVLAYACLPSFLLGKKTTEQERVQQTNQHRGKRRGFQAGTYL